MSKINIRTPHYSVAITALAEKVVDDLFGNHPIFGQMQKVKSEHDGLIRNVRGDDPLDQEYQDAITETSIHVEHIKNSNVDEITLFLSNLADQMLSNFSIGFFENMKDLTSHTGQVINNFGKPLDLDVLNDMLEKMPISFTPDGNPIMPSLIVSPGTDLSNILVTEEQLEREKQIINKKREEFFATKRSRKLS
ncbi:MAG: hypothetical protein JEZ06_21630 [Anaerolineaceae bacterium]|nr:hypothetical protein [Anaerolineaceae bacterium]